MSSAISVLQAVGSEPIADQPEISPSRFVYRISMSRTPTEGYQDLMVIIGDNGDFAITSYKIGLASDYSSAEASEAWAMIRSENVERLGYAFASAARGAGREETCSFIRRPNITDLERECVQGVVRAAAGIDGIDSIANLLCNHGVPFEQWER